MTLIKFNDHPAPGYYDKEGKFITVSSSSVGTVRTVTADCGGGSGTGAGGAGGSGGYGYGAGNGMGSGGDGSGFGGSGMSGATQDRYNPVRDRLDEGTVVEDWIPRDASGLNDMFKLMYHRDPIAGALVDLIAETTWSDFDLTGIEDPMIKKIYQDSMNAIDPISTLPELTREFMVLGRSASSMIFDNNRGIFTDITSHDQSFLRLTPIPIKGYDPKIDLIPSPALRAFVESTDPRDQDARKIFPDAYIQAVKMASGGGVSSSTSMFNRGTSGSGIGGIPLDPINTLFLARKVFSYDYVGTSLFTRLITFWALEKALINATVTSARRRARSIMHLKIGIDNVWEPTSEEMDNIAGMFIQADEDPVGAVVATKTGVDANEVRQGQDFYKWSDEWSLLSEAKFRALGANESLLSDATYSNQETARMFFMEKIQTLRNMLTQRIFYSRFFPLLARIHGFHKIPKSHLAHGIRVKANNTQMSYGLDPEKITQRQALSIPDSELITPTIKWRKELVNSIDEKRIDLYQRLKEEGLPVLLKDLASAGGVDMDSTMADLDADAAMRKRVAKWKADSEGVLGAEDVARLEFINSLQKLTHANIKQVLGSKIKDLGPLSYYPFWNEKGQFAGLEVKKLAEVLEKIDPSSNMALGIYSEQGMNQILSDLPTNEDRMIAHYLMFKTGLTKIKPVLSGLVIARMSEWIKTLLDKHAANGRVYQLASLATDELRTIASLSESNKKKAADKIESTVKKTAEHVTKKTKMKDPIKSTSQSLYTGINK